jgi:hypothetical protein
MKADARTETVIARSVWLPRDQRHDLGRLGARDRVRGPHWIAPKGARGVAAAATLRDPGCEGSAFLVQLGHRAKKNSPLARLRVRGESADRIVEVRAEDFEHTGWQRVAVDVAAESGCRLTLEIEALGESELRIGSIAFWRRRGRPVWILAHMSNSPASIGRDLADGANAIECDVGPRDGRSTGPLMAFHRFAPPYLRRSVERGPLEEQLEAIADSLDRLALVMFDCHVLREDGDYRAFGRRLAEAVRGRIPAERVVFSIPEPSMAALFDGVREAGLDPGFDLCLDGEKADAGEDRRWVEAAERHGATMVGVGTDCFVPFDFLPSWLGPVAAAVNARDRGDSVAKVYYWTLSTKAAMRKMLDLGVDGIVVNDPKAMREVLAEEPYRWLCRPATPADSQFRAHGSQPA